MTTSHSVSSLTRAALYWETARLLEGRSPEARVFFDAMSRSPLSTESEAAENHPLTRAGQALWCAMTGDEEEADRLLDWLIHRTRRIEKLLGLNLAAWIRPKQFPNALADLVGQAERVESRIDRARLFSKAAGLSLDAGHPEEAATLLGRAIEDAPLQTELRRQLLIVAFNKFPSMYPVDSIELGAPVSADDPEHFPSIVTRGLSGARGSLVAQVSSAAESPWSRTMTFGRSLLDDSLAAEMQATWAGALWLRDGTRLQLAAMVLQDAARSPSEVSQALGYWSRSGGKNVGAVFRLAEGRMTQESTDELIREHLAGVERQPWGLGKLAEMALMTWDLVSEEVADSLLGRLPDPRHGDHPELRDSRAAWAVLALRAPSWEQRYRRLTLDSKKALTDVVTPTLAERLSAEVQSEILELAQQTLDLEDLAPLDTLRLVIDLMQRLDVPVPEAWTARARSEAITVLLEMGVVVPNADQSRALGEAIQSVTQRQEWARQRGNVMQGGRPPEQALVDLLIRLGADRSDEGLDALLNSSIDPKIPSDVRLSGLQVLHRYSAHYRLPVHVRREIGRISSHGAPSFFGDVTPELVGTYTFCLSATYRPNSQRDYRVAALARDTDARIRQVAIETAHRLNSATSTNVLADTVLAGMYDTQDEVVMAAIYGLVKSKLRREYVAALEDTFVSLLSTRSRPVRLAVARVSSSLAATGPHLFEEPLRLCRMDASWLVRDAATSSS